MFVFTVFVGLMGAMIADSAINPGDETVTNWYKSACERAGGEWGPNPNLDPPNNNIPYKCLNTEILDFD
jgi:hypothetical protein